MDAQTRCFALQRAGNAPEEYEDALRAVRHSGYLRCAVADGATETSFAGEWARALVDAWCAGRLVLCDSDASLVRLRRRWQEQVGTRPLTWYAEAKAHQGAFAALAGLVLRGDASRSGGRWDACAVGDSCVFHLRAGALLAAFPLDEPQAFGSRPALLGSTSGPVPPVVRRSGHWRPGDTFLLMTDALAQWYLERRCEPKPDEPDPVTTASGADFRLGVEHLRQIGSLRNDDVALVRVDLS